MAALAEKPKAEKTIQMRVQPQVRDVIDRAAAAMGKSRTEFVIESAHQRAIEVMLDQRSFELNAEQWDELMAILDQPPKPNAALKALMRSKAPWE